MKSAERKIQLAVDMLMVCILLLQMSYSIAGELIHEITGIAFFVLFIVHHILSRKYTKALVKGKHNAEKIIKLIVDIMLFIIIIAMMLSAMPISKHIFTFLGLSRYASAGRTVHLLGAYQGFALMSLHIGFHFNFILAKIIKDKKKKIITYAVMAVLSAAGLYFFISEGIYKYMLLISRFVFFDTSGGLPLFITKYLLIMTMFASCGFTVMNLTKRKGRKNS